ncbi:phosphopantetheine-binding protein, partial [Streptomyces cyaneofuscatus]|uniref:phosphopantetheine-binding protein n=1 Tax=Streptomyces cyaneofuscatus TaxID=66883 RepID=UPI003828FBCC
LEAHPHIGRAVVATVGEGGQKKIVAALVPHHDGGTNTSIAPAAPPPTVEFIRGSAADSAEVEAALIESWMAGVIRAGITDSPATLDQVADALGVTESMRRALGLWLHWLVERDVLAGEGDAYTGGKRWRTALEPDTWQTNLGLATDVVRTIADRLTEMTGDLVSVLRGDRDPLILVEDPVLSPEATVTNRPDTESALRGAANTVNALAAELGRPVRVAELGARSGAAAARLLRTVAPGDIELTLFDEAQRLLDAAAERLAGLPHDTAYRVVRDGVLPSESRHTFDVVLANNSLHRYADPVASAEAARQLLLPGGLLIGLEHSEMAPIGLLTAGLIEHGFASPAEERARTGGPLLDASQWAEVLHKGGLRDATLTERDDTSLMLMVARTAADLPVVREAEILTHARGQLPAHMVPERVLLLPSLPLSANGKVDRNRIGALFSEQPDAGDGGEVPRTPMEETVARMWEELLQTSEIGRAHNFFALGGDSLTATNFAEAIRARFGVELMLRQMFQAPTLEAVAASIDANLAAAGATDDSMEDGVL